MGFENWARIEAIGFSGGIWLFWNASMFIVSVLCTNSQFLHCKIDNGKDCSWFLSIVYGSPNEHLRSRLFASLKMMGIPWLLAGYFNDCMETSKSTSVGDHVVARCMHFREWVSQLGLLDLGFSRSIYTWWHG